MVDNFYSHERSKTYDIPLTNFDFKYINKCDNVSELEKILKTLRSGEVGRYAELEECCEEQIKRFDPENRLLRKAVPLSSISQLIDEERDDLVTGFQQWLSEMKEASDEPNASNKEETEEVMARVRKRLHSGDLEEEEKTIQYDEDLPPVRRELVFKSNSQSATRKACAGDGFAGKRVIKPRDYNEWEKLEKEWDKELNEENATTTQHITSSGTVEKGEQMTLSEAETRNLSKLSCRDLAKRAASMPEQTKRQLAIREKEKGNEAFRAGDYNEALVYYKRSLTLFPTTHVYNNRALIYLHQKEWSLAAKDCARVLKEEPDNLKALFRSGRANYELHNLDEAEKVLERLTDQDPTFTKAQNLLRTVRSEKAKRQTQRIQGGRRMIITDVGTSSDSSDEESNEQDNQTSADNPPVDPTATESQEHESSKLSTPCESKSATSVSQDTPVSLEPAHNSSSNHEKKNAVKPKMDHVRRRVVYPPSNPGPYGRQGMVIEEISDSESEDERKTETELKPQTSMLSDPAGDKSAKVIEPKHTKESVTLSNMTYEEAKKLGEDLRKQGNLKNAFDCYTHCVHTSREAELIDQLAVSYRNRAIVALDLHRYQQAVDDCTEALKIQPGHPAALYRRALGRRALGDLKGAAADLEEAHTLLPTSNNIRVELETISQLLNETSQKQELPNNHVSREEKTDLSDFEVVTATKSSHPGNGASCDQQPTSVSPDPDWDIVCDTATAQNETTIVPDNTEQEEANCTTVRNTAIQYLEKPHADKSIVTPCVFQTRWTSISRMPRWEKLKQIVELLRDIQADRLYEVIGIKLDASMLDDIIRALEWLCDSEYPSTTVSQFVYNVLLHLSRIPRFHCGILLISDETIRAINIVFQCLDQNPIFTEKKEHILELKQMYTVGF